MAEPEPRRKGAVQPINVAILGAGKGGSALLELLSRCNGVNIVGVADLDPAAPGLHLARLLGIPTVHDAGALIAQGDADLIIDVTGDGTMASVIERRKSPSSETLGGTAARLLWSVIQQEQELQGQLVHAEKLATMGTFAAGVTHELNNPLHCMMGFAQLIKESQDLAAIREYAQEIIDMIHHLSTMTKSLTLYARAGSRGEPVNVSLQETLDEAVNMSKFATPMDEVTVVKDYTPLLDMKADPGELLQVFVNVIVNAAQAMNGRGRLTLSTRLTPDHVRISVQDTGCGIPRDDLHKVLSPFFTTKDRGMGTGLGLYIVHILTQKYGGRLNLESEVGQGTTIHFEFPIPHPT
jgi:signal transduction histidine kinase